MKASEIIGVFRRYKGITVYNRGVLLREFRDDYLPTLLNNREIPRVNYLLDQYRLAVKTYPYTDFDSRLPE
ncbi:hypothetical protein COV17_02795 [Candidatus Woesearchaeota archaeon CG10_big_fil_rev_8_21_14_0_10_36_11]|nr:MAG: hypothetical protein COV17_02795 [Candidatus Woesearchaeota archaeon CG10_big_fil_rev_8_21_14_0_10_36_11]